MRGEALLRQLLVFRAGTAVIGVRIDGYPPSRDEQPCHFDVFRIHQLDEVLHDHVDAVLVETSVVAEAEEIELQALALDHPEVRDIGDAYLREVRLTGDRAQGREFGTVEAYPVVVVRMLVLKCFQHLGGVIILVNGVAAQGLQAFFFPIVRHIERRFPFS